MQIKIEIDVKPEELRRFLGLPDISGLQDDIIGFLRDKVEAAGEFHPTDLLRNNLDALRKTSAWKNLMSRVRSTEAAAPKAPKPSRPTTGASAAAAAPVRGGSGATATSPRRTRKPVTATPRKPAAGRRKAPGATARRSAHSPKNTPGGSGEPG